MTASSPPWVVTVFGGKGGIGKTTLAEHLAWGFAEIDTTLLVDADPGQASAKFLYDRYRCETAHDVTVENDPSLLGKVRNVPHRYVVIDAPPSAAEAQAAIEVANLIIIPAVPRVLDTSAIMRTVRGDLPGKEYRVVINRVSNTMGQSRVNAVLGALGGQGIPVLRTVVREYLGPHEAARAQGLPVTHPDLIKGIANVRDRERAERAARDLNDLFGEIAALAGAR